MTIIISNIINNNNTSSFNSNTTNPIIIDGTFRLDQRKHNHARNVTVTHEKDMTMVCIGGTKAIAHCHAHVTRPLISSPSTGQLSLSCEITSMADTNPQESLKSHITKELNKSIKNSNTIDLESLAIIPGLWVWGIHCHVKVIDNDGNATDASIMAAIASLLGFKRPDVSIVDQDQVIVHPETEKYPVPLTFHHIPVPTTFALIPTITTPSSQNSSHDHSYDQSSSSTSTVIPVLDPSLEEESCSMALLTINTNMHGQLVSLSNFGSCAIEQDIITKCIFIALNRARPLTESIRQAVLLQKSGESETKKK